MGYWLYQGYPENLDSTLENALAPYGITDVNLQELTLDVSSLHLEGVALSGSSAEQRFKLSIEGLRVGYHWRQLLRERIESVEIDRLTLELTQDEQSTPSNENTVVLNDLLPLAVLQALPFSSLRVHEWKVSGPIAAYGEANYDGSELTLVANSAQFGRQLQATLTANAETPLLLDAKVSDSQDSLGNIRATLTEVDESQWQWQLSGTLQHKPMLDWLNLESTQAQFPVLTGVPAAVQFEGYSDYSGNAIHPASWPFEKAPDSPLGFTVATTVATQHVIESLAIEELLTSQEVVLSAQWKLSDSAATVSLEPFSADLLVNLHTIGIPDENRAWLKLDERSPLAIRLTDAASGEWSPSGGVAEFDLRNLQLNLGNAESRLKLALKAVDGSIATSVEPAAQLSNTQLHAEGAISTRARRQSWPEFNFQVNANGPITHQKIIASLLDTAESLAIDVKANVNLDNGNGDAALAVKTQDLGYITSALTGPLKAYQLLTEDISLSSGQASLTSNIQFTQFAKQALSQAGRLGLENLTGQYGEYSFERLSGKFNWRGVTQWQTLSPAHLTLDKVNVGFDITNLAATLNLPKPTSPTAPSVNIQAFSANVFGGQVYLPEPANWQVGAMSNEVAINASSWELRQLVALQQGQEIDAQGLLEGELPLTVEAGRVIIKDGFLRAIPPGGSIRYKATDGATALADSNEQLGMALELLEDFRFKVLSTDVKLDKAGNLLLGLALSGSNPTQFDGRQVNFNINLDQNIDPLLQSLRLSDTLVEELERRIR
ncbi:MAG: YdbH domain-containing protein [Halioglobus sp.]